MSAEINNGGPAFPAGSIRKTRQRPGDAGIDFVVSEIVKPRYEGITARDYFAAKALAAIVGNENKSYENCGKPGVKKIANWAYEFADAMLEARDAK